MTAGGKRKPRYGFGEILMPCRLPRSSGSRQADDAVSVQESSTPPGVVMTAGRLPLSAAVSQGDQRCGPEGLMGALEAAPNTLSGPRTDLVGEYLTGRPHLPLQQFAQRPFGRLLVAAALDQDVEDDAGLVHGSPKRHCQINVH
jgi:hypothetical protein